MASRSRGRWLVRASIRVYRLLLRAHPAAFRRAYGRDMAQLFGDCCRAAYARRGVVGVVAVWLSALWDLGASLLREHAERLPAPWRREGATPAPILTTLVDAGAMHNAMGGHMLDASGSGRHRQPRGWARLRHLLPHAMGAPRRPAVARAGLLDQFTGRARDVLALAQEEARRLGHDYIGTEHLLLGLIREGNGVAAQVLANLGIDLEDVRIRVERIIGHGDGPVVGAVGLTPRAKRVMELALDETRRLNHQFIGTEHLLLGLVSEGHGIASNVLADMGASPHSVRAETLQLLGQPDASA